MLIRPVALTFRAVTWATTIFVTVGVAPRVSCTVSGLRLLASSTSPAETLSVRVVAVTAVILYGWSLGVELLAESLSSSNWPAA